MTRTALLLLAAGWKRFLSCILLIALLSVTAGLLGVAMLSGGGTPNKLNVVVVDKDNSQESRLLLSAVIGGSSSDYFRIQKATEERAESMLAEGLASAAFILPEGFLQSVMSGENDPVAAIYNPATPVRSALVRTLADTLLELLRSTQSGIYAGLHYAREYAPERYEAVYRRLNMRYLALALANESIFRKDTAYATGELDLLTHYTLYILLFLQTLCLAVLHPLIRGGFSRATIRSLRLRGGSGTGTVAGWAFALWCWLTMALLLLAALYWAASKALPLPVAVEALAVLPAVSLFFASAAVLFAFLFDRELSAVIAVCFYAVVSLVLSGGLIPLSFLPETVSRLARLTPFWWIARLLGGALNGTVRTDALLAVLCHALLCLLLCRFCLYRKGRTVRRI